MDAVERFLLGAVTCLFAGIAVGALVECVVWLVDKGLNKIAARIANLLTGGRG